MGRVAAATLLSLAAIGCAPGAPDPRGVARDEVLLQVAASGRADARPDEARFTAGVQTIAPTAAAASAGNAAAINRMIAALDRLGARPDDIQTRSIRLNRIEYGANRGRFEANNYVEVRVRAAGRAGQAIAAASDAGMNVLSGPDLRVSDPEAASRSAYARAYRAARARADAYASAAGLKVARILAIRDDGDGGGPVPYRRGYEMNMSSDAVAQTAAPAPPVRPGVTTSEVRVRVDFALSD